MSNLRLPIELIPHSSWQSNLRSILKPKMWEEIRKKVYRKNSARCSICQRTGKLQAHEVWDFNNKTKVQKLVDIIPLCFQCHMVKHIGFAQVAEGRNMHERLIKHFMEVNKCERVDYQKHLAAEVKKFEDRSRYDWQLELSKLKDFE